MKILAAIICCDYKAETLLECIESIKKAGITDILLNYEGIDFSNVDVTYKQEWLASGEGFNRDRQFDQDQNYRLKRICIARNMCLDLAFEKGYDWILFVDSDVMIPENTLDPHTGIFNEFDLFHDKPVKIRSGLVPGRGVHSGARYAFHLKESDGKWQKGDYFSCGFMAIHSDVFSRINFRYGKSLVSDIVASEDPLYGESARIILNEYWWCNMELKARHLGDLKQSETSQY